MKGLIDFLHRRNVMEQYNPELLSAWTSHMRGYFSLVYKWPEIWEQDQVLRDAEQAITMAKDRFTRNLPDFGVVVTRSTHAVTDDSITIKVLLGGKLKRMNTIPEKDCIKRVGELFCDPELSKNFWERLQIYN